MKVGKFSPFMNKLGDYCLSFSAVHEHYLLIPKKQSLTLQ